MVNSASSVIAGCFALAAFAVAVLAGLAGGNTATAILTRALIAMVACYPVGLLIGLVCQRVIAEHVQVQADAGDVADQAASVEQNAESKQEATDVTVV